MAKLSDMLSQDSAQKLQEYQKKQGGARKKHRKPPQKGRAVRIPDFVSIDLETTGLDKNRDRITEIGLVKYVQGREVDSFSSLVNPGIPIPPDIVELTGITDTMVAQAPPFAEIMDQVYRFIGRMALCAHKVDFDFYFLNEAFQRNGGKRIRNWRIDTLATARLLLDLHEGYALGKVARALGVSLEHAHRALDDARAGGEVALKLLPMIDDIPVETRVKLARFAPFSFVKKMLEYSVQGYGAEKSMQLQRKKFVVSPRAQGDPAELVSPQEVAELLQEKSPLAEKIPGFYSRPAQQEYAQEIAKSLNTGGVAVMEAGTGTGKTLGYLVPAALWAFRRGACVMISTNTKNLQEQLIQRELPKVATLLGDTFSYTLLKGKGNYVCIKAWNSFVSGETGSLAPHERDAVLPLIKWMDETETGDIEEQSFFNHHRMTHIWQLISAENRSCAGCPSYDACFMQQARLRAAHSHVVVINHALFYHDVMAHSSFTDGADALIFDEAHQLVPTGYHSLVTEIDSRRTAALVEYLQEIVNTLKGYKTDGVGRSFEERFSALTRAVKALRKNSTNFLSEVSLWLRKNRSHADDMSRGILQIRYEPATFARCEAGAGLILALTESIHCVESFVRSGIPALERGIALNELRVGLDRLRQYRADVHYLASADTAGHLFWAQGPEDGKWVKLTGTPLAVDSFLGDFWKHFAGPVVCTSATLSPDTTLDYFVHRAGLAEYTPKIQRYESHFAPESILPLVVKDAVDVRDTSSVDYILTVLADIKENTGKNTVVLFTNNALLEDVYHLFIQRYPQYKGAVFAQRISGNRTWIQNQMEEVEGAILLGSGAFWEGIDIPGAACEIVVIPKLPFPVPTHPIVRAISDDIDQRGGNGFMDYYVQEAVLRFRQGMGRLLRHRDDRGVFLVLDSRMIQKGYGKRFLRVSPVDFMEIESNAVSQEISRFLREE
ncbi:helicase C-terminal domain-containing protein [Chitinivibrio alkaliphilus]|uniref:DNA polymerase III, epsilon subunit n=1 Tax=Chitinivibrio alkaliphilus ACht1 TaxID=1313304 RepID=U7DC29_9BACT|nr:helicase C-terminal domain-containing protein [Chitinivibrio alkaliphilus]ERP31970.1 DNA polymerase III, epsilon subunit [Chitinivibrio alkaliphilus ACht1]